VQTVQVRAGTMAIPPLPKGHRMNLVVRSIVVALVSGAVFAGCTDRRPDAPPPVTAPAVPLTDTWLGQWNGPEGTYLTVTGGDGRYDIVIRNLDGPTSFKGVGVGEGIEFVRDGVTETIRATDGPGTGMKWLADKSECLKIRSGEGYCRK
jgi:hypothetical protein